MINPAFFWGASPWPSYTQVLLALGHLKVCVRTARLLRLSGVTCGTSCAAPRHSTINTVTNMINDAIKMSLEDWDILQHIRAYWSILEHGWSSFCDDFFAKIRGETRLKRHDRKQNFPGCTQSSWRGGAPSRPICGSIPWCPVNCPLSQALEFAFETATECGQIVSNCGRLWSIYTGGSGGVPLGHSLCEAWVLNLPAEV